MSLRADLRRWAQRPGPLDAAVAPHLIRTLQLPSRDGNSCAALLARANREAVISGGVWRVHSALILVTLTPDLHPSGWQLRSDMSGVHWQRSAPDTGELILSGAQDTTLRAEISAALLRPPRHQRRWPWPPQPTSGAWNALRDHWGLPAQFSPAQRP